MTDKKKKRARELAKKTGMSYQAAHRTLTFAEEQKTAAPDPHKPRTVDQLLRELRAVHVSSVLVHRVRGGGSADSALAHEIAVERARNPLYAADSGHVGMTVSLVEHEALLSAGATNQHGVQTIPSIDAGGLGISVQCARCQRWIHSGRHELLQGRCECGQRFRTVPIDDSTLQLPLGKYCMDCGEPFKMRLSLGALKPWHPVNVAQIRCDDCHRMGIGGPRLGPTIPGA